MLILLSGLCATVTPVEADVLAFKCTAPKGYQANYGEISALDGTPVMSKAEGVKWGVDGFSNTNPIAIWHSDSPAELWVSWGDAIPEYVAQILERPLPKGGAWTQFKQLIGDSKTFQHFRVVFRDENQIQALQELSCGIAGSCTRYIWTLFPQLELITMARVGFLGASIGKGGRARLGVYAAPCKRLR